jgi:hypothetical protein
MNHHDKGIRLSRKAQDLNANTPKARRIARRMLRTWANGWELSGSTDLAQAMRRNAKKLR